MIPNIELTPEVFQHLGKNFGHNIIVFAEGTTNLVGLFTNWDDVEAAFPGYYKHSEMDDYGDTIVRIVYNFGKPILARDNYTLEPLAVFRNLAEMRKTYPSAEITCVEHTDTECVIYC